MKLSLIIPFHKGAHYLEDCFSSIEDQNLTDYEVLFITNLEEDTTKIEDAYKSRIPLKHLEIGEDESVAAARNLGLQEAKGTYVYFLDADDYVIDHGIAELFNNARSKNAQVTFGKIETSWFKKAGYLAEKEKEEAVEDTWQPELYDHLLPGRCTMLHMMFQRLFLKEHEITFDEGLFFYSELLFMAKVLKAKPTYCGVKSALYIKRKHNDPVRFPALSQMKGKQKEHDFIKACKESIKETRRYKKLAYGFSMEFCDACIKMYTDKIHGLSNHFVTMKQFHLQGKMLLSMSQKVIKKYHGLSRKILNSIMAGNLKKTNFYGDLAIVKAKGPKILKNHTQMNRLIHKFIFKKLKMKNNWVVFESFLGKKYADSCKYIYEYMYNTYGNQYRYIWILDDLSTEIPGNPKKVKRFSLGYFYYIAKSKYWVNNMRQPPWLDKREGSIFLETWHGTPLKKLVFDMDDVHSATPLYKLDVYNQSRDWDYFISDNPFSSEVFQSAFLYEKEKLLEMGYPRNDIMYDPNKDQIAEDLKKELGIPLDKKTILYAPTWRDDDFYEPGKYKFTLELDLERLQKELGDEYVILLRTHYFIADQLDLSGMEGFAYNLSNYGDISELYLISDICITDYSSVFFDYANLKRPILFFTYDLESYRDVLRGFYIDIEKEVPGPLLFTNDEIIHAIKNIEQVKEEYSEKYEAFYQRFCCWDDGQASKRIVEKVFR
ncbi:MAG: bifunctional glycosyltransferase/CDP-glycerol:glycerophosphate glycerophosphotransferase [Anaerostipes sp.]|jgi:CDP-glycerol glycerophosphotransferase